MSEFQAIDDEPFTLRGRNPDVLSCIANLSNDEVFTPPDFANRMLDTLADGWAADHDGESLWSRSDVTFLDPCTKSGVFLREITRRLLEGLADEIPDLQARVDHILTRQVFGIGVTQLTALLARRSLYCSKDATGAHSVTGALPSPDGHVWWERTEHSWDKSGKGKKCVLCGASRGTLDRGDESESYAYPFIHTNDIKGSVAEMFGDDMQFDVIIGNPPYQLDDGGHGKSAAPIYQHFIEQAKRLDPKYLSMVVPSRWFAGGKGLQDFREEMLSDPRLRVIEDYLSAADVFPGVGLKGGVHFFLWDRDFAGECEVTTNYADWPESCATRPLLEHGTDVFIRFNEGVSILRKVTAVENANQDGATTDSFADLVGSARTFGFRTYFKGRKKKKAGDLKIYQNGEPGFVARDDVTGGADMIDSWKIFVSYAAPGTGNKDTYPHRVISTPFLGEPQTVSSETYLPIGPFANENEARNALRYLSCKLTRLLIQLRKSSQHVTRKVYSFVPVQDWSEEWTDEKLYAEYGITEDEQAFIDRIVRPMTIEGVTDR